MLYDRMNLHTFMRKYFAPHIHASQGWFTTRANRDDEDLVVSPSLLTPSSPSIGDAILACEKGRDEIMKLILLPFGVGFPTKVIFIYLQLRDVNLNSFSLPERGLGDGMCLIHNYLRMFCVKPNSFFFKNGIMGDINIIITMMATEFYLQEGGLAHQACILEAKQHLVTMPRFNNLGRPFIDHFPLSAFCLILTFVYPFRYSFGMFYNLFLF